MPGINIKIGFPTGDHQCCKAATSLNVTSLTATWDTPTCETHNLRDTTFTGANFLIADLHSAILAGTNLLEVRNLTTEQIDSAIYDSSTLLETEVDITQPQLHAVKPVMPLSPLETHVAANPPQVMSTVTTVAANESAFVSPPETPLPPLLNGEAESLIPPLVEPLLSSSPVTSDSLEDTGTEIFDTATHRPSRNDKKQAKAR